MNGGLLPEHGRQFQCVCEMTFAGETCEVDVSDLYFYMAALFWQNLFQILSYLILRFDDEPEVDWGDNE